MSSVHVNSLSVKERSYGTSPIALSSEQDNRMRPERKTFLVNRQEAARSTSKYVKKVTRVLPMIEVGLFFASEVGYKIPLLANNAVVTNLPYAAGGSLVLEGALKINQGVGRLHQARRIGDKEGKRRARADIAFGTVASSASSVEIARLMAGASVVGLGFTASALAMIASSFKIGICMLNIYRSLEFYSDFRKISENKQIDQSDRLVQAIEFLKNKVSPTREERLGILEDGKRLYANLGSDTKQHLMEKKLSNLAQTKIDCFKRRCNLGAAKSILEKANYLLTQLRLNPLDLKIRREAQSLIQEVQGATRKRMMLYGIAAVISGLALTGLLFSAIVSVGLVPIVLYSISSLLILGIAIYPMIAGASRDKKDLVALSIAVDPIAVEHTQTT